MTYGRSGSAKYINLIIIFVVCGVLAAATMLLPKGFSDNLSIIGQGSVVVVLSHDKNAVGGAEMMVLLNKVRSDYEGRVDFLAVDVDSREGHAFIQQQGVSTFDLVLFGPDGSKREVLSAGTDEQELRSTLDNILSH